MKIIVAVVSLAVLSGALAMAQDDRTEQSDPLAPSMAPDVMGAQMKFVGVGGTCLARISDSGPTGSLDPEPNCAEVFPRLEQAVSWTEQAGGAIRLSDEKGMSIMLLAPGDGMDYEAVEPQSAFISVTFMDG